jgi:hypothetical protein
MVGLLERADEIGFEQSLDLIIFLLVLSKQLLVRDRIVPRHPISRSRCS